MRRAAFFIPKITRRLRKKPERPICKRRRAAGISERALRLFYFQKNSTPGRRMGDRGALDRFTIELYKSAKEMSIENSKKCGYFSCF